MHREQLRVALFTGNFNYTPDGATKALGRLVEHNSSGPLRLGYGAWRDLLLGCQFHNGRGELITAGGRTVKNVAGYDLTKFMVGQGKTIRLIGENRDKRRSVDDDHRFSPLSSS